MLPRSGEDGNDDKRPDFGVLDEQDEMGEQAIKYFNQSVVKQRPMAEDEKENDGSKCPAGSTASIRQQIKRRKTQLISSQKSSVIINDP